MNKEVVIYIYNTHTYICIHTHTHTHTHRMEHYLAMKKNILPFVSLDKIMPSEISQIEKDKYYMVSFIF